MTSPVRPIQPHDELLKALPWLILAAALRVIIFGNGPFADVAMFLSKVAVLQAFLAVTRRSIELAGGRTGLFDLTLREEVALSLGIITRIGSVMLAASAVVHPFLPATSMTNALNGLDGMAFDQWTFPDRPWSAFIAVLVLLMIVGAERNAGAISLFGAARELAARWVWLGAGIVALTLAYVGLTIVQEFVRSDIRTFWQMSDASQFVKNLIFFVFVFSFAMIRLWLTLFILTWCLKQSYLADDGARSTPVGT